ncbi:SMC-Scp complex subunit ScpB [Paenibacillus endoradicis]|uniref:SMC-Scp complex subunit ScpB n=1 Tax=Paenibacillus endoradicis TaxID=2972487 RepID=UPI0021595F31|nr:SMC-Scp complex subunit ScpB [Paenibacillus endoradicis]MCR8660341.1 SMC-Scp complex subunit ScpB [Paenibacillus endoradicis]
MEFQQLKSIIEGLLFMAGDEGLNKRQLADIMGIDVDYIEELVLDLQRDLERDGRGVQIGILAGSYRLTTHPEHAAYFERMAYTPTRAQLSQAALETLSIVAYKQPITRVEIEEIRGVKCERAIHTLVAKDLIEEVGRAEAIGRPILYGTTKIFLDSFGLASIKELPEPKDVSLEDEDMDEQTQLLFERFEGRQMTLDEVKE